MTATTAQANGIRFSAGRFWSIRLASFVAVLGVALGLQYWIAPSVSSYDNRLIMLSLLFASLAVSLNLINGITGQFSIGHAAFFLVGAYTTGKLTDVYFDTQPLQGLPWLVLMSIVGALAAGVAGFIVGLPSLRLRGDYLAIVTLGFGEIARIVVINQDGGRASFAGLNLGGAFGMNVSPKLAEVSYVFLLLVLTIAVSRNLLKTAHGLSFLSVREDELAAEATGVNTTKTKVTAFVLGAALAGMAGCLFAHYEGFITPDHFDMNASFIILTMVVIGGTGSITGAAFAGIGLTLLQEALRKLPPIGAIDLLSYIAAAVVIVVLVVQLRAARFAARQGPWQIALLGLGLLGSAGGLFAAFSLYRSGMTAVIKFPLLAMMLAALCALLLTRPGRAALPKFGLFTLCFLLLLALRMPLAAGFHSIPFIESNLSATEYSPSNLRMATFALSLVVMMLIRPQGLFGHHEFSWSFVAKSFGLRHKDTAIHT